MRRAPCQVAHPRVLSASVRMVLAGVLVALLPRPAAGAGFGFADVVDKARKLAQESFKESKGQVPDWLLKVTYDQWRDIRFRPDRA